MNVVRLTPRRHRELDTADAEVGKALVALVERHGVFEVATILVRYLAEIIVRVRARRNADCDEWLEDLRRQFNAALPRRGRSRGRLWGVLVALLGGCVAVSPPAAVPVTDTLSAPMDLFKPVCARFDFPSVVGGARWDGGVQIVWQAGTDTVTRVQCHLTSWNTGAPERVLARIDINDPKAQNLRAFLTQNGISVLLP